MKAWHIRLEQTLSDADAPPVLTRDLLDRFARSARNGKDVAKSTLSWWVRQTTAAGKLVLVQRGLYLNRYRTIPDKLADTVPLFHEDAVVSLNTVLGDAGVLNNPTNTITAVVPFDSGLPSPHLGRKLTKAGSLHFFGIPRHVLQAGKPNDRLEPEHRFEHARATPEKALIDWLYLAESPRSHRASPPRGDIDLTLLKLPRLRRLASDSGLLSKLSAWETNSTDAS